MIASEFAWTFPIYILGINHTLDAATENVDFDDKVRFIAPEPWSGGPCAIALFTDPHLAQQFRDEVTADLKVDLVPLQSPTALKEFLELAKDDYLGVVVDLNRKTQRATPFMVQEVINEMNQQSRQGQ